MNWKDFREKLLEDPEVKKEYERLCPYYEFVDSFVTLRRQRGINQKELARRTSTKQSAIARLESGKGNPTLGMLVKVADALDAKLEVKLIQKSN
jgi:transcriptional regulator with XRE-family HTH domain